MKKIIAAMDAVSFSEEQLIHFHDIAKMAGGRLTIVFLENIRVEMLPVANPFPIEAFPVSDTFDLRFLEQRRQLIRNQVNHFHTICSRNNLDVILHEKTGMPLESVIIESRFSDLLLINNHMTFATSYDSDPPKFVRDILREAQCPVLVLPSNQKDIRELLFTYNGSFSSMYAIRQFTCLFQNLFAKKLTVLYVDDRKTGKITEEALLKDYLKYHYNNWEIELLSGEPSFEIMSYLMTRTNSMVTLGAYGRSKFSQFFHHSDAEKILHTINTYFFITHP
jgi:nucleotide-binding universal stress UspA family protein